MNKKKIKQIVALVAVVAVVALLGLLLGDHRHQRQHRHQHNTANRCDDALDSFLLCVIHRYPP